MKINKNWQELNIDTFKQELQKHQGENVYLEIKTLIRTTVTFENCQILINKLNIIISDSNYLQIDVDIDPLPHLYKRANNYYKIFLSEIDGEILLDFYK